jgi:hypothetical protein
MTIHRRICTVALAFVSVCACVRAPPESDPISWSLGQDIAFFRNEFRSQNEMIYRIDELSIGESSDEYQAFVRALESAPDGSKALIYYEVAPSAEHFMFALAVENASSCIVIVSDRDGVRRGECQRVPAYSAAVPPDGRAVRDPAIAGLVQFDGQTERRAITLVPAEETIGLTSGQTLFDKVARVFE